MSSGYAQSPVKFGVKGGINLANISGTDTDFEIRQGMIIGASVDFSLPMLPIGVESGVYYTQKGAEFENIDYKIDYIEVPVLAKVSLGPPGPISPHLIVGPTVGFMVNSEIEDSAGNTLNVDDTTTEIEFGGLAGVGADFNVGLAQLNAQIRYNYGFTKVYEDSDDGNNAVLSVVLGISF